MKLPLKKIVSLLLVILLLGSSFPAVSAEGTGSEPTTETTPQTTTPQETAPQTTEPGEDQGQILTSPGPGSRASTVYINQVTSVYIGDCDFEYYVT